jgi:hypothetical protein
MVHFKIYLIVSIGYNKLHLEPGANHWPMSSPWLPVEQRPEQSEWWSMSTMRATATSRTRTRFCTILPIIWWRIEPLATCNCWLLVLVSPHQCPTASTTRGSVQDPPNNKEQKEYHSWGGTRTPPPPPTPRRTTLWQWQHRQTQT